jgi:hypothetical protein
MFFISYKFNDYYLHFLRSQFVTSRFDDILRPHVTPTDSTYPPGPLTLPGCSAGIVLLNLHTFGRLYIEPEANCLVLSHAGITLARICFAFLIPGLAQQQIAELIHTQRSNCSKIESGQRIPILHFCAFLLRLRAAAMAEQG